MVSHSFFNMYMHIAIDIYINMCILIYMNIYITPTNEKLLREYSNEGTMSGLINSLLEEFFNKTENPSRPIGPLTPESGEESQEEPEKETLPRVVSSSDDSFNDKHNWEVDEDPYKYLIFDSAAGRVADTRAEDYLDETTPEMIKELKKRKQVR